MKDQLERALSLMSELRFEEATDLVSGLDIPSGAKSRILGALRGATRCQNALSEPKELSDPLTFRLWWAVRFGVTGTFYDWLAARDIKRLLEEIRRDA